MPLPCQFTFRSAEHCRELVPFTPKLGPGYIDDPVVDESSEDQHRSYIRRDFMQLVKYAAFKVECLTGDWDYGNFPVVGLGDMSTITGGAPIIVPAHITHEDGNHIDIAYYQLYAPDNSLRPVGRVRWAR